MWSAVISSPKRSGGSFGADVVFGAEANYYFADKALRFRYWEQYPRAEGPYRYRETVIGSSSHSVLAELEYDTIESRSSSLSEFDTVATPCLTMSSSESPSSVSASPPSPTSTSRRRTSTRMRRMSIRKSTEMRMLNQSATLALQGR